MNDSLQALLWLEWKRLKSIVGYWRTIIGIEDDSSPLYLIYVLAFWVFWLVVMWSFVVQQVYALSHQMHTAFHQLLSAQMPSVIFYAQLTYIVLLLRDPPMKLTGPDSAYIAASPLSRGILVVRQFLRRMLPLTGVWAFLGYLINLFFTFALEPTRIGVASLQAFIISALVALFSGAVAWLPSLMLLNTVSPKRRVLLWIAPLIILGVSFAVPQVLHFPGLVWQTSIGGHVSAESMLIIAIILLLTLIALLSIGARTHMTRVADASAVYIRVQRLGIYGKAFFPDVIRRIEHQTRLARKTHVRLTLPHDSPTFGLLVSRALLSMFRLSPKSIIIPVARGATLTILTLAILNVEGWVSIQVWGLVLSLYALDPPTELVSYFRQDISEPFLKQFSRINIFTLFLADTLFPICFASLGALAFIAFQGRDNLVHIALFVPLVGFSLALSQALAFVSLPKFIRFALPSIPYEYTILAFGAFVIFSGHLFGGVQAAILAAGVGCILLSLILRRSSLEFPN